MDLERIISRLKIDEGFSPEAYWDNDQWTYGFGTKAPGEGATITRYEAETALRARVIVAVNEYQHLFGSFSVDEVRQEAICNMLFNLGVTKFTKFKRLNDAIRETDWGHAAYEAFHSLWFRQLRKKGLESIERSERIVWELLTGERA